MMILMTNGHRLNFFPFFKKNNNNNTIDLKLFSFMFKIILILSNMKYHKFKLICLFLIFKYNIIYNYFDLETTKTTDNGYSSKTSRVIVRLYTLISIMST